jgi:hypothetical protein
MRHLILVAFALALAPAASAQLYKYVDKDGKTVYSDTPPANVESKQLRIQSSPAASSPAPVKSALAKDKELEKGRKDSREQAKKGEEAAKAAQAAAERCAAARNNYAVFEQGTRILKRTESGERVFLEENEIAAEKQRARAEMDEACKKT